MEAVAGNNIIALRGRKLKETAVTEKKKLRLCEICEHELRSQGFLLLDDGGSLSIDNIEIAPVRYHECDFREL